jgi:signal peptidase I
MEKDGSRTAGPPSDGTAADSGRLREVRRLVRDLLLLVGVAFLGVMFLFQPFKVEGASMQPALVDHERILVNKLIYRLRPVERGDVVVFWFPGDPHRSFVKRVIGVPGDRVTIRNGQVSVNGEVLDEPYLISPHRRGDHHRPVTVQEGHYFVLGDHRNVSNDSRAWGQVPERLILGKAVLRYWPPQRMGTIQ